MDSLSLAGVVLQFLQFSCTFISRSKEFYQSSRGSLARHEDAKVISQALLEGVKKLKVSGFLAETCEDDVLRDLFTNTEKVAEELLLVLETVTAKGKHKKWSSFKAAILSVYTEPQVQDLEKRLDALLQAVQFYMSTIISKREDIIIKALEARFDIICADIQALSSQVSAFPKQLDYLALPEDHVKIDDGLGTNFVLPLALCSTPKDFIKTLTIKYESSKLPGLRQVERGHFELFDWNERTVISEANWSSLVRGGSGVKLSYVMGTWTGTAHKKCIRCFKFRNQINGRQLFKICSSCGLKSREVVPDAFHYEPQDMEIGFSPDQYRDYLLKSRPRKQVQAENLITCRKETESAHTTEQNDNTPPIDMVCRRLTFKWEPIFNIVHRYLFCRCVIRLSTPSRIGNEITILVGAICPRHNTKGIDRRDYGDIEYHEDPYFDRFGGYNSFRAIIFHDRKLFEKLGAEKFLPLDQLDASLDALAKALETKNLFYEYAYETYEEMERIGVPLPDSIAKIVREERLRRRQQATDSGKSTFSDEEIRSLRDSPLMRQLNDILGGKWSGIPHWAVKD